MTENTVEIDPEDVEKVAVPTVEGKDHYRVNIRQGKVRIGDTKKDTFTGSIGVPGDRGKITPEKGDEIWVRNVGINKAVVEIVPKGLEIDWYPNQKIQVTDKVFPGVETDTIQASNDGDTEQFKDQEIPEGSSLAIKADGDNTGQILINGETPIGSQVSLTVSNMSAVDLKFTDSGDKAYAVAEVDN